jgi:hypothetical protein
VYPLSLLGNGSVNTLPLQRRMLEASFCMRSVSYQGEVGDMFFPELLVYECSCISRIASETIKNEH